MEMKPRFVGLILSLVLVVLVIELVRRRKLREEYSWLWLSLGVAMFILALWPALLRFITDLIGAVVPTSTLFFFGLIFVLFINIQFSMEISRLSNRVKDLAQHIALLETQLEEAQTSRGDQPERVREAAQAMHGDQLEGLLEEVQALQGGRKGAN